MSKADKIIALAGNPNVGKSTVFNSLTGMNQHTGNWPGKTVCLASGRVLHENTGYVLVDLPGCYSLMSHSAEEEVARDFICFQNPDAVIVVCDATCLIRNMNLVLQTMEITDKVIICINLMDEAKKKGIIIDTQKLSTLLGVPIVATSARSGDGLSELMSAVTALFEKTDFNVFHTIYDDVIEKNIAPLTDIFMSKNVSINPRWLALKSIFPDESLRQAIGDNIFTGDVTEAAKAAEANLIAHGITGDILSDKIVKTIINSGESIAAAAIISSGEGYSKKDRRIDTLLTGRLTGVPIMLLLLAVVFWLTITGANYPSQFLNRLLFGFEDDILRALTFIGVSEPFLSMIVFGVYRVLAWVISVMLPPMAIFFPAFTLLEDLGYLPRVAFNLDKCFKKCNACGKQALTMCMGFGCNAAGVIGCRIIENVLSQY